MTAPRKRRKKTARKPSQARSREMVDVILLGATRVFAQHGYARATTNRVAQAAGVSVGSLYQYFPDKDAILTELLARYRAGLVTRIGEKVAAMNEVTFERVVHALLTAILKDDQIHPALHRVLIERVLRTDARRTVSGFEERLEELIASALVAGKEAVSVPDPDLAAFVLVRVVLSVVHAALVDKPAYNTPTLVDELTRLIVGYVGARPEGGRRR